MGDRDRARAGMDSWRAATGPTRPASSQQDLYYSALGDLSLTIDPLTQNRYSLAGGTLTKDRAVRGPTSRGSENGRSRSPTRRQEDPWWRAPYQADRNAPSMNP